MIVNFDGGIIAHGTTGRADKIVTAEVRLDLVREARINWGLENNIDQIWHRGYVAVKGGAMDCPYTFMQDVVAGTFRLPWEDQVVRISPSGPLMLQRRPRRVRLQAGFSQPRRVALCSQPKISKTTPCKVAGGRRQGRFGPALDASGKSAALLHHRTTAPLAASRHPPAGSARPPRPWNKRP
jgi:hypothetical protein